MTGKRIDLANEESLKNPLWVSTVKQKGTYRRMRPATVEEWFRIRSEEFGKKITPHSFRAYLRDALHCEPDFKALILAQTGKYGFAHTFTTEDKKRLKEAFLDAVPRINPLYTKDRSTESN